MLVNYHCIIHYLLPGETWKTSVKFFLLFSLATAIAGCLSNVTITSHMSPFWTFCTREPSASRMNETYSAWECSALCDVHIILYTIKTYSKRRDYLFSFNLSLDLLTLALENLYFNPLDLEKVQGKSLGCIKSQGDTSPAYCTPTLQGATAEGWKSRMRLASCGLPTPALGNTAYTE